MVPVARTWGSDRRLTAIGRTALSVPARQALADRQITPDTSVLDYGCGRGGDLRTLRGMEIAADGWDPHYRPDAPLAPADVVLLTYVLNIIEDPTERRETLRRAWDLASTVLIASARLTWDRSRVNGDEYTDGILTGRGTFQHLFGARELRDFVRDTTGTRCVAAAPGIVYAFKDDRERVAFLARRIIPHVPWPVTGDTTAAIAAAVDHTEHRGRVPRLEEMPPTTAALLSHLRPTEVHRLVRTTADPDRTAAGARRTTLDTLLFLAVELFNGRGPFGGLPLPVQLDVRAFFASYKEACRRADRLLLKLRDDTYLHGAMHASTAGRISPTALYVHRRALDRLPIVLRLYEHCAAIAAGRPATWTIAKLAHRGRSVAWLDYPDFDTDAHPRLAGSYTVDLKTLEAAFRSHADDPDRPVLHRKHEFLAPDDPDAPKYRRLTAAEARAGLYARPHLIATETGWQAELDRCARTLRGHRLVRRAAHPD
ncbi:DNA phosphorothioation-associated putative methyltransferase [Embleya sp. AB8]|uniref:DNA phosphorothioation-associated putative methyltransferase n=1 Tax=Embleya sp. AB8 TaxID=3156304 RepID=UPI003C7568DB